MSTGFITLIVVIIMVIWGVRDFMKAGRKDPEFTREFERLKRLKELERQKSQIDGGPTYPDK